MRAFLLLASLLRVTCVSVSLSAATWYVDASVSESGDGKSWATAFQKIQDGVDAASHADTVTVAEGTYVENIRSRIPSFSHDSSFRAVILKGLRTHPF